MKFIILPGYGVNARDVTIFIDRISHFSQIDYNGKLGTCITTTEGEEICISVSDSELRKMIRDSIK